MPIYEFYCSQCNTVFNFFSRRINTTARPDCPRCGKKELDKLMSSFATIGKAKEASDEVDELFEGMDEKKVERAFAGLLKEAEAVDENDPKAMARLMRRFSETTGLSLGEQMEEAISRLEAGADPDEVEADMGDLLEGDEPFSLEQLKKKMRLVKKREPRYDDTLYEL